jgi:hypothetical protein
MLENSPSCCGRDELERLAERVPLRVDRLNVAAGITVFQRMSQIKRFNIMVFHNIKEAETGMDRVAEPVLQQSGRAKRLSEACAQAMQRINKLRDSERPPYGRLTFVLTVVPGSRRPRGSPGAPVLRCPFQPPQVCTGSLTSPVRRQARKQMALRWRRQGLRLSCLRVSLIEERRTLVDRQAIRR